MSLSRRHFLIGSGLALAPGLACKRKELRAGSERPLMIVLSPAHKPADTVALRGFLEARSGLRIELRQSASNEDAIDLVERQQADAGLLALFDGLFCDDVFHTEPLVQVVRGTESSYEGEILVRKDSDVQDLVSLRGLKVGFVDRYSVTGFLLPAKVLRDQKVDVEAVWLGSHDAVLAAVKDKRVVAGATFKGAGAGGEYRSLVTTPKIANEPLFVQPSVGDAERSALKKALLALGTEGADLLRGVAGITSFREIPAGTYEDALATLKSAGSSVEDMVPGGWTRASDLRRPLWTYAP